MPKFLEKKLKREYGAKSKVPYKVMNSIGAMLGSKETAKGAAMQRKHDKKTATRKPAVTSRKVANQHMQSSASSYNWRDHWPKKSNKK